MWTWNQNIWTKHEMKYFVIAANKNVLSLFLCDITFQSFMKYILFYKSNKSALQCVWSSYFPFIPLNHQTILSDQNTWFDCLKSSLISSFIGNPLSLTNLRLHFRYAIYHKFFLHENSIYFTWVSFIDITWNWFLRFSFSTNHSISKLL